MKLILASGSPHRAAILKEFNIEYITHPPNIQEIFNKAISPAEIAADLAKKKAQALLAINTSYANNLVLAADTIVIDSSKNLLRKPQSSSEAMVYLNNRSESFEHIVTGFYLTHPKGFISGSELSLIHYDKIPKEIKQQIISSKEWQGVCGGLKVEGIISPYVKQIKGSIYNIRGLPIEVLKPLIEKIIKGSKSDG